MTRQFCETQFPVTIETIFFLLKCQEFEIHQDSDMTLEASVNWDFIYHIFKINKFKLLKCFYKILRKVLKN